MLGKSLFVNKFKHTGSLLSFLNKGHCSTKNELINPTFSLKSVITRSCE